MTALAPTEQMWNTMPGWGIVADLTPPELTARRQLAVIRKLIAVALIALVVVCAGGFVWATMKHSHARSELSAAQDRTYDLQAGTRKYADVTTIQGTIARVESEVSGLMASDVDFPAFVSHLRMALPNTMTIQNLSLTFSQAAVNVSAGAPGSSSLDPNAAPTIGRVTMTGSARRYTDVSTYVDALSAITGIAQIVPTSSTASDTGVTYNITFVVTNELLSHRYDSTGTGVNR